MTATLFKIADLQKLVALTYAYEEDLPDLARLPRPIPWQVRAATHVPDGVLTTGWVDLIGPIIDPNQHTALVMGRVDNPGPDRPLLRRPIHYDDLVAAARQRGRRAGDGGGRDRFGERRFRAA